MKEFSRRKVEQYMRSVVKNHYDPVTFDYNFTTLAEDAAHHFGHDEWLDISSHVVWDISVDIIDEIEKSS